MIQSCIYLFRSILNKLIAVQIMFGLRSVILFLWNITKTAHYFFGNAIWSTDIATNIWLSSNCSSRNMLGKHLHHCKYIPCISFQLTCLTIIFSCSNGSYCFIRMVLTTLNYVGKFETSEYFSNAMTKYLSRYWSSRRNIDKNLIFCVIDLRFNKSYYWLYLDRILFSMKYLTISQI